ncbi:MAG: hypothetical protein AAB627_02035 [Patescibacteria group bacterium]
MAKKFASFAVVVALAVMVSACQWMKGNSPTSPSDSWPSPPQPPANPAPYASFFDPIDLSEDEWKLTLKFNTLTPPSGSTIFPVQTGTQRNPCPQYCLYYSATFSLAKRPPNNVSCDCPNWGADVILYLSYDGVNKGQQIRGTSLGALGNVSDTGLEVTFGNAGTNFQIPLFGVPEFIIIDWNYRFMIDSNNGGVRIQKSGTKAVRTWYTRG